MYEENIRLVEDTFTQYEYKVEAKTDFWKHQKNKKANTISTTIQKVISKFMAMKRERNINGGRILHRKSF